MKNSLVLCVLVAISVTLSLHACALEVGETAENWTLNDEAGQTVDFHADSAGAVSVVLYWATWCPYCRTLMPHLQKLADEFRGRPVKFYALDVWEDGDPVAYMRKRGFTFRLLLVADAVARANGITGTPGLFVMGPDHKVIYKRQSGEDDLDVEIAVREAIEAGLGNYGDSIPN